MDVMLKVELTPGSEYAVFFSNTVPIIRGHLVLQCQFGTFTSWPYPTTSERQYVSPEIGYGYK